MITPQHQPVYDPARLDPRYNKINYSRSVQRLLQTLEINDLPSSVNQLYDQYYKLLKKQNHPFFKKKLKALHSLVCECQKIFFPVGVDIADLDRLLLEIQRLLEFYKIHFDACSAATQLFSQFGRRRYSLKEVDAMYDRYVSMYKKNTVGNSLRTGK